MQYNKWQSNNISTPRAYTERKMGETRDLNTGTQTHTKSTSYYFFLINIHRLVPLGNPNKILTPFILYYIFYFVHIIRHNQLVSRDLVICHGRR